MKHPTISLLVRTHLNWDRIQIRKRITIFHLKRLAIQKISRQLELEEINQAQWVVEVIRDSEEWLELETV